MVGGHCVRSWSNVQKVIALSSGEAELYALIKGASVAIGARSLMREMGIECGVELRTDSSAAKGAASRVGIGRLRHVETSNLWTQERVQKGEVRIVKIAGASNPPDVLTKHVGQKQLDKCLRMVNVRSTGGRRPLAPAASGG